MKMNGWLWAWVVFLVLWVGGLNVLASGKELNSFVYFAIWAPPFFLLAMGYAIAYIRRGPPDSDSE